MRRGALETAVGVFVVAGLLCLGYLSLRLGKLEVFGARGHVVRGVFSGVGGLSAGAGVEIAGVTIGRVERVELRDYRAVVTLRIDPGIRLPDDSMVSVRTRGLIGDRYISLTPGASQHAVRDGGTLRDTEDAIDVEQLIAQLIHGKV